MEDEYTSHAFNEALSKINSPYIIYIYNVLLYIYKNGKKETIVKPKAELKGKETQLSLSVISHHITGAIYSALCHWASRSKEGH